MNLIIKLIIKPLRSLLKLLFNRIFYVALALVVQLSWLLIALFRLMEYSRWVTIGMQVVGFLVVLWIVNKKINPSYKLAWTMLILIFPVFACLLIWLLSVVFVDPLVPIVGLICTSLSFIRSAN